MNIFVIDHDPVKAAKMQCDKHVVKMIVESAQILCTTHRVLDGTLKLVDSNSGKRKVKHYELPDRRESILYKTNFINHPCNVWVRESIENYKWLFNHLEALLKEYRMRYNKQHSCEKLINTLRQSPNNIPTIKQTPYALAFKEFYDTCLVDDPIESYQNYYKSKAERFSMVWTKRMVPEFMHGSRYIFKEA